MELGALASNTKTSPLEDDVLCKPELWRQCRNKVSDSISCNADDFQNSRLLRSIPMKEIQTLCGLSPVARAYLYDLGRSSPSWLAHSK